MEAGAKRAYGFAVLVSVMALTACSSGGGGGSLSPANVGGGNNANSNSGNAGSGNNNAGGTNSGSADNNSGNSNAGGNNSASADNSSGNSNAGGTDSASADNSSGNSNAGGTDSASADNSNIGGGNGNGGNNPPAVSIVAPGVGAGGIVGPVGARFTDPLSNKFFRLTGNSVKVTTNSVSNASLTVDGIIQNAGEGGERLNLSIPSLGLNNILLQVDGTPLTLPDGSTVNAAIVHTDYTVLGAWGYVPSHGGESYLGQIVAGYSTNPNAVPTTGTATYSGAAGTTAGVRGAYAVPSGTGTILSGTLSGDVTINVDFAHDTASGSLTNMLATPIGGGATTPWNDVSLSGKLTRDPAGVSAGGIATTNGPPAAAGPAGLSSAATGLFIGVFYGPAAQELGGAWKLSESTGGGKAAYGTFGAAK